MLTIQQAGTEILEDHPKNLYFFGGEEYGIKCRYIDHLTDYYKQVQEMPTVSDALAVFRKKQLFPLPPKLYIVRYDDTFISALNEHIVKQISKLKIKGTIVCIYEDSKAVSKCNKFFPDNTVTFEYINPTFIKTYLTKDFPDLSVRAISEAVRIHPDYMGAYNICVGLNVLDKMSLDSMTSTQADQTFGYDAATSDIQLRQAFAAKNVYLCANLLDKYVGDKTQIFYIWLAAMLELEKLLINPKQKSDLGSCVQHWDIQSVYNMFQSIYAELETSRNVLSYNIDDRLLYLVLLLQYNPIPERQAMTNGIY